MKQHAGFLFIALSICVLGYFLKDGIETLSGKDRTVSVKGLSERTVLADNVTWSLSLEVSGNDLPTTYSRLDPKMAELRSFLLDNGVLEEEIYDNVPTSEDRSQWYEWEKKKAYTDQYVVTGHLTVVSKDVEKIRKAHLKQSELLKRGLRIENSYPSYTYTGLADLKPEMVEEATRNARATAQKFAKDADCDLGSIRTARQGQFEVESDDVLPHKRKVRVVTTIEYFLK